MDISIDQIREIVTDWADPHREIKRVFLFGSRARGDSTSDSDVDLALVVVGIEGQNAYTRYHINMNVWKDELKSALGRSISMVRLSDNSDPKILAAIARDGVLLCERLSEYHNTNNADTMSRD